MFLFWTFAAALAFAVGSGCMKASDGMVRSGPTLAMYITFAAGATFQALALREAELGVAYMFSLGLEAVLVFTFGQLFFAESVSLTKVLGVASVVVGMVMMNLSGPELPEQAQKPNDVNAVAEVASLPV